MKVIGLTGGVGAGKSTILKLMQEMYRCEIIEADRIGHALMVPGGANYKAIVQAYGSDILLEDGQINRKKLASIAFVDRESTEKLNTLTHPNICQAIVDKIEEARLANPKYEFLILEAAMIHQAGLIDLCDEVWYVYVPWNVRKKRIMESRGYDENRAEAMMQLQPSEEMYRAMSTWEIQNDTKLDFLSIKEAVREKLSASLECN